MVGVLIDEIGFLRFTKLLICCKQILLLYCGKVWLRLSPLKICVFTSADDAYSIFDVVRIRCFVLCAHAASFYSPFFVYFYLVVSAVVRRSCLLDVHHHIYLVVIVLCQIYLESCRRCLERRHREAMMGAAGGFRRCFKVVVVLVSYNGMYFEHHSSRLRRDGCRHSY